MKLITSTEHIVRGSLFITIFLFAILLSVQAQSGINADFGGYFKELGQISISNDFKTYRYDNILHHRIESEFDFGGGFELRADLRTRLLHGWSVRNTPGYAEFLDRDPGYFDLSHIWINDGATILHTASDRLHLSYTNGPWELHVGRQRINWGKSMVWNPNDLFNSYAYLDFDYEERPGTDAVYLQYNWSYASSVDIGYRPGNSLDESVIAFMYRDSFSNYDIQFIGGNYFEQFAIGAGWTGYIESAGFKGEVTYFHPRNNFRSKIGHVTATAGGDYMFSNSIYLTAELLYNGGWERSQNPVAELTRPPSADDLFISQTGFFINSSYPITPLTNISGGVIGSFTRPAVIFIPQVTHSLSQNIDLLVLAQIIKGSVLESLTVTPNLLFFRLKWSY